MNCPKCYEPLRIAERQGIEIDYCPDCRGVWLDRGELDKIIERTMQTEYHSSQPSSYREREKPDKYHSRKGSYNVSHGDHYKKKHKYYKKKHIIKEIFDIFD